jgi:hypothetical protein
MFVGERQELIELFNLTSTGKVSLAFCLYPKPRLYHVL